MTPRKRRCAIYTRKSTDEGLDQDFNSLDAQQEACAAYVMSQTHEGWEALDARYDDGGFSGGSMERPGLTRLIRDIEENKIDIVVVYKVDRLTRSLADFAKLVEVFDRHSVSFVSVTQAFNTTSSMGRLTLNVLLSFAQFEREVTAERIRDKFKASKEKGMWMGGRPLLGYDIKDRGLVPNEEESPKVRYIFETYLELGSALELKKRLEQEGIVSKQWITQKGKPAGGRSFSRGSLYELLQNPIYIGKIRHKDKVYEGLHEPILDPDLWARVQTMLAENRRCDLNKTRAKSHSLLAGILFHEDGQKFSPKHSNKKGVRHRYYVHAKCTLPAREIEAAILSELSRVFSSPTKIAEILGVEAQNHLQLLLDEAKVWARKIERAATPSLIALLLSKVVVTENTLQLHLSSGGLRRLLRDEVDDRPLGRTEPNQPSHLITLETNLKRCGQGKKLIIRRDASDGSLNADTSLLKLIARAHMWFDLMKSGLSYKEISDQEKVDERLVARTIQCAFLAPDITSAILTGQEPKSLTYQTLVRLPQLPPDWNEQRELLGFV